MEGHTGCNVLNAKEYLSRLVEGEASRRFKGGGSDQFAAWRADFRRWLCGLLGEAASVAAAPVAQDVHVLTDEPWHGCLRTELTFRNGQTGLLVPATILRPQDGGRTTAGIVCQHGHGNFARLSVIGDRSTPELEREIDRHGYDYGLGLAKAGYTIIAIDLLNFGSRAMDRPQHRDACDIVGLWLSLFSLNLVAVQLGDIRNAISVLAAWEGVDPERIGMCGLSLGGRMTMFVAAVDERVKVAVASGSCNTYRDRIKLSSGLCGAQVLPGMLPHADTPEVFASIAPRPLQLQWGSRDPLIVAEFAQAGIDHIQGCYAAAGHPEEFEAHRFEGEHEFDLRAALRWFETWL